MNNITNWSFIFIALVITINTQAQVRKIDTTAGFGSWSYHVYCNNKDDGENTVSISPKGFGQDIKDMSFPIKGRLHKILVDDLNEDGYPDLLLCVYGGINGELGNIVAISSNGNNAFLPVRFPDIYSDPKLSEGYKGYDEFTVLINTLMQSFPVYKPGDTDTPTGGIKVIQYGLVKADNGYTFKVLRSYIKLQ